MDWSRLFTVDEPGLHGKTTPDQRSINKEETLRPGSKGGKGRLTLLFGGNASSDTNLKPLSVYHSENPRALRKKHSHGLPSCCVGE